MKILLRVFPVLLIAGFMALIIPMQSRAQEKTDLYLRLIPDTYSKSVKPGKFNEFFLELNNPGDKPLTDIKFSSLNPEGWVVEFRPDKIDYIGRGSIQTVDVNIKPARNAAKGEYRITFVAETREIRKINSFEFRVETVWSFWLWIGVALVFAVIVAFVAIFRRYGHD